ncbi:PI31 proteasome regulator N-terminal [Trichophyton interdigitale]|uniref:PI31 proteasome regulator N-terminal n=1 Tax=Trichophyton interdigitale TaxID=101480 RepID=A0A9P4YGH7_9EURO|nr:PI31 proteasome regulator N-terminal [Trichophyton interdigitale]KAG5210035.1 PI31 proteasome regulator N-terminal [Trichophyton interdigitale]KAG8208226.1 PI31 proteasome regulator N-terminal [Trichophyton interdigitale]
MQEQKGGPEDPDRTLAPGNIISTASRILPRAEGLRLKSAQEAVALVGHACMVESGFRLIGLGEEHRTDSSDVLPRDWNLGGTPSAFKYSHSHHPPSEYLLQVNRLGSMTVIYAVALFNSRTTSFDISTDDFISDSKFPIDATSASEETISSLFVSQSRLEAFFRLFDENIVQKLMPDPSIAHTGEGESKEPLVSLREQAAEQYPSRGPLRDDRSPGPTRPYPFDDPLAIPSREPIPAPSGDFPPPRFEDEYEINSGPRGSFPLHGGYGRGERQRQPVNIGERDLYPQGLAPHDPLQRHLGPTLPGRGGFGSGGGMHPTFDDPMFGGGGRGEGSYDLQVPPGARYDPVGPGDGRPYGRGSGSGGPGSGFPGGPGPGPGGFGGFGGFGGGGII